MILALTGAGSIASSSDVTIGPFGTFSYFGDHGQHGEYRFAGWRRASRNRRENAEFDACKRHIFRRHQRHRRQSENQRRHRNAGRRQYLHRPHHHQRHGDTGAVAGSGSIAASSGVKDAGTFDISASASGASITTLSSNGAVTLGSNTLTLTAAAAHSPAPSTVRAAGLRSAAEPKRSPALTLIPAPPPSTPAQPDHRRHCEFDFKFQRCGDHHAAHSMSNGGRQHQIADNGSGSVNLGSQTLTADQRVGHLLRRHRRQRRQSANPQRHGNADRHQRIFGRHHHRRQCCTGAFGRRRYFRVHVVTDNGTFDISQASGDVSINDAVRLVLQPCLSRRQHAHSHQRVGHL